MEFRFLMQSEAVAYGGHTEVGSGVGVGVGWLGWGGSGGGVVGLGVGWLGWGGSGGGGGGVGLGVGWLGWGADEVCRWIQNQPTITPAPPPLYMTPTCRGAVLECHPHRLLSYH